MVKRNRPQSVIVFLRGVLKFRIDPICNFEDIAIFFKFRRVGLFDLTAYSNQL